MSVGSETIPKIELLSAWFCPYAQRAWIALEEKCPGNFTVSEAMERKPPNIFEKTPLLLEKNPKAQVPVIIDRRGDAEVVVYESLICVEFVDEAMNDDDGPVLLPGPPSQRANARMWTDKFNNDLCSAFYSLLLKQDKDGQESAAEKILTSLREFAKHCKGPFFYGEEFTMVDIAIAPWAVGLRMDVLEHYRNFEVPRTGEYAMYWEWVSAVSKRPSFITTTSNLPAMIDVYRPYAEGTAYTQRARLVINPKLSGKGKKSG
mmetsp:Transcript_4564/g.8166  ORF Transcript_4564/g.8166 Transcript_4564/m.8166 type:complete len:261 (-) Transcript_4564:176-958(-)